MTSILAVRNLNAAYRSLAVLSDVSIDVPEGGMTALLGANGAGKTTLLRSISNVLVRATGEITFDGRRIDGQSCDAIARAGIAHVPDGRGTFSQLSVEENLCLGAISRRDKAAWQRDMARMYEYFPRLHEYRRKPAGLMSGGEQQMLAIARALMLAPKLLMLDEPSFGLAPMIVRQIFDILRQINSQRQLSILLVEQNASLALDLATNAYVLEGGRVTISGPSSVLRGDERVRRAYLGHPEESAHA
ncbi:MULTISPECIES: ABC transporter ATP-binding protein [Cupriavidus]|jgi:branched-chain amino acid transport system ATP-binding protein|uniref:ABC transporter ATP-binding protein n=1 Tax=Cupriavidus pauculus TaxID=82633 RepID=A0A5P2HEY3_9BURK|nr:ABC transporter ATP-binding protein [Cupriavidus pauculus]QET06378.1 ABC transporter ATP-binding protein [Cupriavidus pauculus]